MRRRVSRKDFLKMTGAGLAGASLLGAAGCGGVSSSGSSGGGMWRQFAGTTLNFVSENTSPTTAIAANLNPFKELTGINVNVLQLELGALVQKVALDIGSGEGAYQVIYADPYQIMAPYHEALADLNEFNADENLPSIPKGVDDFIPTQLAAAGRFENEENLYALPYDCPTMIWMYRKDLFDKHGDKMSQDLGFDPTPSPSLTWEQYFQIANWFNQNQDEVPYGTGHQARQYDSLMCDFSNILWSYGGDYFHSKKVGSLGAADPLTSRRRWRPQSSTRSCSPSRTLAASRGTGTLRTRPSGRVRSRWHQTGTSLPPSTRIRPNRLSSARSATPRSPGDP
jgi:multiple sugar transport system substrate-binding protein